MIKFLCTRCHKKIGTPDEYAGKLIQCPRCKKPVRVPGLELEWPQEEHTHACRSDDREGSDPNANIPPSDFEVHTPSDTQTPAPETPAAPRCTKCLMVIPEDSEFCVTCGHPAPRPESAAAGMASASKFQKPVSTDSKFTSDLPAIIGVGIGIVLVVVIIGFVIFGLFSAGDSLESNIKMKGRFSEVQDFVENYTRLLNKGEIIKARELHSSELNTDVKAEQLEKIAEVLGKGSIQALQCWSTNFEELPKGNQFYLSYSIQLQNEFEQVAFSVLELDEKLEIDGIATHDSSGNSVAIGPYTYSEIIDSAISEQVEDLAFSFFKLSAGLLVIITVLMLFHIVVM